MSQVFIVGGAGKIGRRLSQQLSSHGHQALALYRNPEQTEELKSLGAIPVPGSLLELDVAPNRHQSCAPVVKRRVEPTVIRFVEE